MSFHVVPMPTAIAEEARRTGKAPGYGHPVLTGAAPADGYGPCRSCLRRTHPGERRLLMTYNPYPEPGQVPVAGPVFIHEQPCAPFSGPGFPQELRGLPMVLQGHLRAAAGLVNRRLDGASPEADIEAMLRDPQIEFLTLRNAEAGCFIARVERREESGPAGRLSALSARPKPSSEWRSPAPKAPG